MAIDGIVLSNIVYELNTKILGGRIGKVTQPEKDELILTVRSNRVNHKLLLSSMASMPKIHLTAINKINPITAPNFCMLLRKHLVGGEITAILQPEFERIIIFEIENLDEMGETVKRKLIIEIMGRHSNIILADGEDNIIDAIRRVGAQISSVREVFPNRPYVLPPNQGKTNPLHIDTYDAFVKVIDSGDTIQKAIYGNITGFSPSIAEEICYRGGIEGNASLELAKAHHDKLYEAFEVIKNRIASNDYDAVSYMDNDDTAVDFSALPISFYHNYSEVHYDSISELIEAYYLHNSIKSRISQKSSDLRKLVHTNLERCYKKLNIQLQQIKDTQDRDKFKIRGELINANLYQIKEGDDAVTVLDYYNDNKERVIKLDPRLTPSQNAQKQYDKYNKKKRTLTALTEHIEMTKAEITHLESVKYALENALKEEDLLEVRQELMETGYIRFRKSKKEKALQKAQPMHYRTPDGFDLYVGKNNYQNDELSTKFANGSDWWFHAKETPGSHVILKSKGLSIDEIPDHIYEQAAALAAYYSKDRQAPKLSVDYIQKKHLKKPNGSAPGYVIYHTNYSMMVAPSIDGLEIIN